MLDAHARGAIAALNTIIVRGFLTEQEEANAQAMRAEMGF